MIDNLLGQVNFPVAFDAAIGHVDDNMPLLHGAPVRLSVTATATTVTYL
jgi:muramoyltetrapeptide carboxypeptidase LdcA involved in peptidoglycan recycling